MSQPAPPVATFPGLDVKTVTDGEEVPEPRGLKIHLTSGQTIELDCTEETDDLGDDELLAVVLGDLTSPPRPHWVTLEGAALIFTQSIAAIELT